MKWLGCPQRWMHLDVFRLYVWLKHKSRSRAWDAVVLDFEARLFTAALLLYDVQEEMMHPMPEWMQSLCHTFLRMVWEEVFFFFFFPKAWVEEEKHWLKTCLTVKYCFHGFWICFRKPLFSQGAHPFLLSVWLRELNWTKIMSSKINPDEVELVST